MMRYGVVDAAASDDTLLVMPCVMDLDTVEDSPPIVDVSLMVLKRCLGSEQVV